MFRFSTPHNAAAETRTKALDLTTLALVIIGGLNWGLVGLFDFDLVTAIFGLSAAESAEASWLSRIIYIIVALSALWQIKVFAELASDRHHDHALTATAAARRCSRRRRSFTAHFLGGRSSSSGSSDLRDGGEPETALPPM